MLYIHPPIAVASYIFTFLAALFVFKQNMFTKKGVKTIVLAAWVLILLALVTGMFWAQLAWGSYWSWDPKEVLTLTLFLAFSAGQVLFFEGKWKWVRVVMVVCCALAVATAAASFISAGLHTFL